MPEFMYTSVDFNWKPILVIVEKVQEINHA